MGYWVIVHEGEYMGEADTWVQAVEATWALEMPDARIVPYYEFYGLGSV